MSRPLKSRDELLDAMAYAFIYSADPSTLDPVEQRSFRDDILSILRRVEEEISQSTIDVQRNWFCCAKEKIEEGISLFDERRFEEASRVLGQAEDIFRSGISAHTRKTDFVVRPDGTTTKNA
jgi:hypothetical protein